MTTELREHALRVLRHETTHSLPLRLLRERLRPETGDRLPTAAALEQELARDERFRLLRPPTAGALGVYADALQAAGLAPEVRVLLAAPEDEAATRGAPLGRTRDCLLDVLRHQAHLAYDVSVALAELESLGERLADAAVTDDGADPSTTPPRDPPAPARSRRRWRPPASPPPRPGGSRSG